MLLLINTKEKGEQVNLKNLFSSGLKISESGGVQQLSPGMVLSPVRDLYSEQTRTFTKGKYYKILYRSIETLSMDSNVGLWNIPLDVESMAIISSEFKIVHPWNRIVRRLSLVSAILFLGWIGLSFLAEMGTVNSVADAHKAAVGVWTRSDTGNYGWIGWSKYDFRDDGTFNSYVALDFDRKMQPSNHGTWEVGSNKYSNSSSYFFL